MRGTVDGGWSLDIALVPLGAKQRSSYTKVLLNPPGREPADQHRARSGYQRRTKSPGTRYEERETKQMDKRNKSGYMC
jgi:hypothetical protein